MEDATSNQKRSRFTPKLPTAAVPVLEVDATDYAVNAPVSHPNMLLKSKTEKQKKIN